MKGELETHLLSETEENEQMTFIENEAKKAKVTWGRRNGFLPGVPDSISTVPEIKLSQQDLDNIKSSKAILYIFVVLIYKDKTTDHNKVEVAEFCSYYAVDFSYRHNCHGYNLHLEWQE